MKAGIIGVGKTVRLVIKAADDMRVKRAVTVTTMQRAAIVGGAFQTVVNHPAGVGGVRSVPGIETAGGSFAPRTGRTTYRGRSILHVFIGVLLYQPARAVAERAGQ